MTLRMTVGFALGLTMSIVHPALAQQTVTLTVEDAVTRGLAEAPRLAEARAREAAADAVIASRAAMTRPLVTASSGYLRTNHVDEFGVARPDGTVNTVFFDIPNNYRARAEVTAPIFTSGRVRELLTAAEADRRAAGADTRTTTADVALEIVTAYWSLVMARERVGVLDRALARADASLETVRARVEAGVLPPNDVSSAQAQRARQNVQLIQARNEAALAEANLARLVGIEQGRPITLSTTVDRSSPKAAEVSELPQAALIARATGVRPERQALTERETALRATAEAALAATRPQVGVLAGVEPARPNIRFIPKTDRWNTSWDLGVSLTWNVWDGGRARADRTATMAQADAVHQRAAEFDALINVEVRQRVLDLDSSRAALAASGEAVDAAAEARRVLGERFAAGVATNTEVLDADVALLEAELERTRLMAGLRLSEARLLRTVGEW